MQALPTELTAGANIGPSGTFDAEGVGNGLVRLATTAGTAPYFARSDVAFGADGLFGFQLGGGNYGWIRLRIDDIALNQNFKDLFNGALQNGVGFADKVTAIDWAYEDSGATIAAGATGATGVPAPASLALLAAGAVGVGAFRRRKQEAAKV